MLQLYTRFNICITVYTVYSFPFPDASLSSCLTACSDQQWPGCTIISRLLQGLRWLSHSVHSTLTNTLTITLPSSLAGRHIKCSGQQTKSRSPCAFRSKYFRLKGSGVFAETQTCFCLYSKVSSLQNVLKYEDEDTKIKRFLSIVFVYIVTFSTRIDCAVTAPIIHAFIFQHKKFCTLKA